MKRRALFTADARALATALAMLLVLLIAGTTLATATPSPVVAPDNLTSGGSATAPSELPFEGCTDIIVGKSATVDGSTITTYSSDGPSGANAKINVFPAKTYKPGTMTRSTTGCGSRRPTRTIWPPWRESLSFAAISPR